MMGVGSYSLVDVGLALYPFRVRELFMKPFNI
jgi:hypothetical protein